jgi:hypothetical protein
MDIKTKYDLKQMLYLVHDPEQLQRMVREIHVVTPKLIRYELACGSDLSEHYEHELCPEKNVSIKVNN